MTIALTHTHTTLPQIRNMHTVSELGHTGDVIACIEALKGMLEDMSAEKIDRDYLKSTHFVSASASPAPHAIAWPTVCTWHNGLRPCLPA